MKKMKKEMKRERERERGRGNGKAKITCPMVKLFGPCFKTGRTRPEKKREHVSWSSQTHAKHLRMNPLVHAFSAASGYDHGAQLELGLELALSQRRLPLLAQVKIEWAEVWRTWRPRALSKTP